MERTIFVVDDNETNLIVAREALIEHYRVMTMPSASKMFDMLEKIIPDLILLDIKMPDIDGFDALHRLKNIASYADIPVIFLTTISDAAAEARGFQLGAVDFITKPFSAPVLLNRIKTHLDIDKHIRERTEEIQHLQNSIIYVIADMVENRDHETGGHIERTTRFIKILIDAMAEKSVYINDIFELDIDLFVSSARLHDVGKIAIPDNILNKPGKLTEEELKIMKTHAEKGEIIIDQIITRAGNKKFLNYAKLFAGYHHEYWNGKGYPRGLAGKDIPFHGRIMAFADVYDALISKRPYKEPFSHEEAVKIITDNSGILFDPLITKVFIDVSDQFKAVRTS